MAYLITHTNLDIDLAEHGQWLTRTEFRQDPIQPNLTQMQLGVGSGITTELRIIAKNTTPHDPL